MTQSLTGHVKTLLNQWAKGATHAAALQAAGAELAQQAKKKLGEADKKSEGAYTSLLRASREYCEGMLEADPETPLVQIAKDFRELIHDQRKLLWSKKPDDFGAVLDLTNPNDDGVFKLNSSAASALSTVCGAIENRIAFTKTQEVEDPESGETTTETMEVPFVEVRKNLAAKKKADRETRSGKATDPAVTKAREDIIKVMDQIKVAIKGIDDTADLDPILKAMCEVRDDAAKRHAAQIANDKVGDMTGKLGGTARATIAKDNAKNPKGTDPKPTKRGNKGSAAKSAAA